MEEITPEITIHLRDDGESIPFCRSILQSYSAYFEAYLNFEYGKAPSLNEDSASSSLVLDDIPGWAVKASLKHLQSTYRRLSGLKSHTSQSYAPEDLYSLIVVSDYFQMESLKEEMMKELILMIDSESLLTTLNFAIWWHLKPIEIACREYLIANLEDFYRKSNSFPMLPFDLLLQVCESDQLMCDEEIILSAIIDWLQVNFTDFSEQAIHALVQCIRYAWISPDHLNQFSRNHGQFIEQIPSLKNMFKDASNYHSSPFEVQRNQSEQPFNKPRLGRLMISKFSCLDETLKCFHSTSQQNFNAVMPFSTNGQRMIAKSPQEMEDWLNSHSVRVVKTYQHSSGPSSSTVSPSSTPIDISPLQRTDPFGNIIDYFEHARAYEPQSIVLTSNDVNNSNSNTEIVGRGMYYPADGVFYFLEDEDANLSDQDD